MQRHVSAVAYIPSSYDAQVTHQACRLNEKESVSYAGAAMEGSPTSPIKRLEASPLMHSRSWEQVLVATAARDVSFPDDGPNTLRGDRVSSASASEPSTLASSIPCAHMRDTEDAHVREQCARKAVLTAAGPVEPAAPPNVDSFQLLRREDVLFVFATLSWDVDLLQLLMKKAPSPLGSLPDATTFHPTWSQRLTQRVPSVSSVSMHTTSQAPAIPARMDLDTNRFPSLEEAQGLLHSGVGRRRHRRSYSLWPHAHLSPPLSLKPSLRRVPPTGGPRIVTSNPTPGHTSNSSRTHPPTEGVSVLQADQITTPPERDTGRHCAQDPIATTCDVDLLPPPSSIFADSEEKMLLDSQSRPSGTVETIRRRRRRKLTVLQVFSPSVTRGPRAHLVYTAPSVEAEYMYQLFLQRKQMPKEENTTAAAGGRNAALDAPSFYFQPWGLEWNEEGGPSLNAAVVAAAGEAESSAATLLEDASTAHDAYSASLLPREDDADDDVDLPLAEVYEALDRGTLFYSSRFFRQRRGRGQRSIAPRSQHTSYRLGTEAPCYVRSKTSTTACHVTPSPVGHESEITSRMGGAPGRLLASSRKRSTMALRSDIRRQHTRTSHITTGSAETSTIAAATGSGEPHVVSSSSVTVTIPFFLQKFIRAFLVVVVAQVRGQRQPSVLRERECARHRREDHAGGEDFDCQEGCSSVELNALAFVRQYMSSFKRLVGRYVMCSEIDVLRRSAQSIFAPSNGHSSPTEATSTGSANEGGLESDPLLSLDRLRRLLSPSLVCRFHASVKPSSRISRGNTTQGLHAPVDPFLINQLFLSGKDAAWQPLLMEWLGITRVLQCYAESSATEGAAYGAKCAALNEMVLRGWNQFIRRPLGTLLDDKGGPMEADKESASYAHELAPILVERPASGAAGMLDPLQWRLHAHLADPCPGQPSTGSSRHSEGEVSRAMWLYVSVLPLSGKPVFKWVIPAEDTDRYNLSVFFQAPIFSFLQGGPIPPPSPSSLFDASARSFAVKRGRCGEGTAFSGSEPLIHPTGMYSGAPSCSLSGTPAFGDAYEERANSLPSVLVHCSAGMHRSCGMVTAFLLWLLRQCRTMEVFLGTTISRVHPQAPHLTPVVHGGPPPSATLQHCMALVKRQRAIAEPIPTVAFLLAHFAMGLQLE